VGQAHRPVCCVNFKEAKNWPMDAYKNFKCRADLYDLCRSGNMVEVGIVAAAAIITTIIIIIIIIIIAAVVMVVSCVRARRHEGIWGKWRKRATHS
jgi:hypothetical protein